jgi:hypothetical protein
MATTALSQEAQRLVDDADEQVVMFVARTTRSSGVPLRLEDAATAERVARVLRGAS